MLIHSADAPVLAPISPPSCKPTQETVTQDSDSYQLSHTPFGAVRILSGQQTSVQDYPSREGVGWPSTLGIEEASSRHMTPAAIGSALVRVEDTRLPQLSSEQPETTAGRATGRQGGADIMRDLETMTDILIHMAGKLNEVATTVKDMDATVKDMDERLKAVEKDLAELMPMKSDLKRLIAVNKKISRKLDNANGLLRRVVPFWKRRD